LPRLVPLAVLLSALLLAPHPSSSQTNPDLPPDLPPGQPQIAFTLEYRLERNLGGRFDWGKRRLFVSGPHSRDELLDGELERFTVLADRDQRLVLRFEPDDPARIAKRQAWNDGRSLPLLAQGYGTVVARLGPPRLLGERQIAGLTCLRLVWETVGERQEWCVTAQGLALAARRNAGVNETKVEAMLIELNPPDPSLFTLPPGFTVAE